ncbi:MAG: hypothetical protein ACLFSV_11325 [Alkalispirochaeta sp.]
MGGRVSTIGVIALLFLGSVGFPGHTQDPSGSGDTGGWQPPEGTAILERPVRWDRHIPVFPANDAKYYYAPYRTLAGRVEVYVTDPGATRLPPASAGDPIPCETAELTSLESNRGRRVLEVLGSDRYRLFLVYVAPQGGESDEAPEQAVSDGLLCSFAFGFIDAFDFFLDARGNGAGALSFSGERYPEFPAVIELGD